MRPLRATFQDTVGGSFTLIPRHARLLDGYRLATAQWEELAIPINLAFFFRDSSDGQVKAMYPSPAGAVESLLPLETWTPIVAENPCMAAMRPDVEALLVNRVATPKKHHITPIDRCMELVGVIRMHWRGLSGGETVWQAIDDFYHRLENENA